MVMLSACTTRVQQPDEPRFMVADPGHFHAALVFKENYDPAPGEPAAVFVYAPEGSELVDFTTRVGGYNSRSLDPTRWDFKYYTGGDFFSRMLADKPGNILVLAGNNQKKTEYILDALKAGIDVFADKPMAINPEDFELLKEAFILAEKRGLLLYDIMTERFEITSILQKELMHIPEIFGELLSGTPEQPAVVKESVHHFSKLVSGTKLQRPPWFFDVEQQGEGIVDVTTHLADLVQWACFPEEIIDYQGDVELLDARRWPTMLSPEQFAAVTRLDSFPSWLTKDVDAAGNLQVFGNGAILYRIRGIAARIEVRWDFEAPEGGGDSHFSVMRGSLADLEIRQGADQQYRPGLYLIPKRSDQEYHDACLAAIIPLQQKYPGIEMIQEDGAYRIVIPDRYRTGHEAHFGEVTRRFLEYREQRALPDWEVPNMLAKYELTTRALTLAQKNSAWK